MKKALRMALTLGIAGSLLLSGCTGSTSGKKSEKHLGDADTEASSEESTDEAITLINGKAEIDSQLQELSRIYEEETGERIEIISEGINEKATDYVKEQEDKNENPDIFVCEAADFEERKDRFADLTNEEWLSFTRMAYTDPTGKVIGFPYEVEACGITYNRDILEKANVDPSSLTGPAAYQEAFERIEGMKGELGLDGVVAYGTNPESLGWSTGSHLFGQYLDAGLDPADTAYIDLLNDGGKTDTDRLRSFGEFVGLLNQYSNPDLLVNGSYGDQVQGFAAGKYAFITQGSWIGTLLSNDYSDLYGQAGEFRVGIAPFAFEEGIGTVLDGPTSYWAVNKDGNVEKAKLFLLWCSMDTAQQILVDEAGLISPFDNSPFEATDPMAGAVTGWLQKGKYSSFHTFLKKKGLSDALSPVFNDFAKGEIADSARFSEALAAACDAYYHK